MALHVRNIECAVSTAPHHGNLVVDVGVSSVSTKQKWLRSNSRPWLARLWRTRLHSSFDCQKPDGHWVAEVSSDATFTSEYTMFKYAMGLDLKADGDALRRWLLQDQKPDGSWGLARELPGNVSTTDGGILGLEDTGGFP